MAWPAHAGPPVPHADEVRGRPRGRSRLGRAVGGRRAVCEGTSRGLRRGPDARIRAPASLPATASGHDAHPRVVAGRVASLGCAVAASSALQRPRGGCTVMGVHGEWVGALWGRSRSRNACLRVAIMHTSRFGRFETAFGYVRGSMMELDAHRGCSGYPIIIF